MRNDLNNFLLSVLLTAKGICNKMTGTARELHSILTATFFKTNHSIKKSVPQGRFFGQGDLISNPDLTLFDSGRGRSWLETQ